MPFPFSFWRPIQPVFGLMYLTPNYNDPAQKTQFLAYINNTGGTGCQGWVNTHTKGLNIRVSWWSIETSEGGYDWDYIDAALAQADLCTPRKQISLLIVAGEATPDWVYGAGDRSDGKALKFHFQTGEKTTDMGATYTATFSDQPFPWDSYYLSKWTAFIDALGARYGDDSRIAFFGMSGYSRQAESFITAYLDAGAAPHGTGTSGVGDSIQMDAQAVTDGFSASVNPTSDATDPSVFGTHAGLAGWYYGASTCIARYMAAFPRKAHLILITGSPYPTNGSDTAGSDTLAALSLAMDKSYLPRYGVESDGLSPGYGSGNFGYNEVYRLALRASNASVAGYQFVLRQQDDTGYPDTPGSRSALQKFSDSCDIGISRGARYIQCYAGNADDATFADTIDAKNLAMGYNGP